MPAVPTYTEEIGDRICAALERLGSLRAVCREPDMPERTTVMRWVRDDIDGFAAKYARSKAIGIDEFVEETLDIADDGRNDWMERETQNGSITVLNTEAVQRSKIRIETRRWLAERMLPKVYGLKTGVELTGADGGPIQLDPTARAARIAHLMGVATKRGETPDAIDPSEFA